VVISLLLLTAIFTPTDKAFAKVENLDAVLSHPGTVILTKHVIGDTYLATELMDGMELFALGQQPLKFSVMDDVIMANGAKLVETDIIGYNGVVHAIESLGSPGQRQVDAMPSTPTAAPTVPPSSTADTAGTLAVSHLMALIGSLAVAAGIKALCCHFWLIKFFLKCSNPLFVNVFVFLTSEVTCY
jgi:hypothetical protein